jgi:hypothetical protein
MFENPDRCIVSERDVAWLFCFSVPPIVWKVKNGKPFALEQSRVKRVFLRRLLLQSMLKLSVEASPCFPSLFTELAFRDVCRDPGLFWFAMLIRESR